MTQSPNLLLTSPKLGVGAILLYASVAHALTCPTILPSTSLDTPGLNGYLWASDVGCVTGPSSYRVDSIALGIGNNNAGRVACSVYTRSGATLTEVPGCRTADTDASACALGAFCTLPLVSPSSCTLAAGTAYLPTCLFSSGATDITYNGGDGRWFKGGVTYPTFTSPVSAVSHNANVQYAFYLNLTDLGGAPTPTPTLAITPTPGQGITVNCPNGITPGSTCVVVTPSA